MSEIVTEAEVAQAGEKLKDLLAGLNQVLFGQEELIEGVVTGLLAAGHILLEGLPGLGKTELAKSLGKAMGLEMKRVQFTPDLLPGDITGNPVLQESGGERTFVFQKGPLFANIVLADEINRASPKTQSALLEAMQERRVTAMGVGHMLPLPFFVLATQNPIELEGTYPLPEAQLDRFLFKLDIRAGSAEVLERIVKHRELGVEPVVEEAVTRDEFLALGAMARRIYLPDVVANYIARLVDATHKGNSKAAAGVRYGASPRAAIALAAASRSRALLKGRLNASFEDVRALARPVFQHRLILDYNAKLDGQTGATVTEALLAEVGAQDADIPATLRENGS